MKINIEFHKIILDRKIITLGKQTASVSVDVAANARDIRRTIAAIPSDDELCVTRARSHTFITAASLGDNARRHVMHKGRLHGVTRPAFH